MCVSVGSVGLQEESEGAENQDAGRVCENDARRRQSAGQPTDDHHLQQDRSLFLFLC